MTFDEWWAVYSPKHKSDSERMNDAWKAAEAATREELLTQFNRTGIDIDAALHGRVNEKSPIASRLRMIAAAVGVRRPSGYAYRYRSPFGGYTIRFNNGESVNGCGPIDAIPYWFDSASPDATGEKEQEARNVT